MISAFLSEGLKARHKGRIEEKKGNRARVGGSKADSKGPVRPDFELHGGKKKGNERSRGGTPRHQIRGLGRQTAKSSPGQASA